MIILNKLYSETDLFEDIVFQEGLNLILGKYSSNDLENSGVNGIGKSSIIRFIDLALLSTQYKTEFNKKQYSFLDKHTITLDFSLNGEVYRIKRMLRDEWNCWFAKPNQEFIEYEETELKKILGTLFFTTDSYVGYIEDMWFRDLIHFFIKDDLNHRERNDPKNFVSSHLKNTKLNYLNFFLLGIPNRNIIEYETVFEDIKSQRSIKKKLESKIEEETNISITQLKSELYDLELKINIFENSIDEFKFLPNYEYKEKELITLNSEINEKIKEINKLIKEQKSYEKSYQIQLDIDIEKTEKIYKSINTELSKFLKKSLNDIVEFRSNISKNRKTFLNKRLTDINDTISKLRNEISLLEETRSKIYKELDEVKALDSIKNSYKDLIQEKTVFESNTFKLNQLQDIELAISKLDSTLSNAVTHIIQDIQEYQKTIESIRSQFFQIMSDAVFFDDNREGSVFEISGRSNKNSPIVFEIDVPKSTSLGNFNLKFLTYDLTVFLHIIKSKRALPFFLIHDGVFHGIEIKKIVRILNYINSQYLKLGKFQYIFTANEHELLIPESDRHTVGEFNFQLDDVIIKTLEDVESKMFFRRDFK
jgi:uncharacterized protein YydD (DUF2326 family)